MKDLATKNQCYALAALLRVDLNTSGSFIQITAPGGRRFFMSTMVQSTIEKPKSEDDGVILWDAIYKLLYAGLEIDPRQKSPEQEELWPT